MRLRTEICDLLGIEYPILQGGMAWASTARLVSAVSNAGGLGIIGSGQMPPEILREEIRKTKALTSHDFGVNVMLMNPQVEDLFEIIQKEKVPLVTTGAGNPGKYINTLKEEEIKVIPVVPSIALAQRMERMGADAVIAEGTEAGGHVGELTTMVLVPQIADAVDIPVIAAGGIADGRGLAAALVLGAKGVQIGTRFLCSEECTVHLQIKERIVKAKDRDTTVTGRSTGHPVRVLKNKLSREFEQLDAVGKGEEIEKRGVGTLRKAMQEGDIHWGSLMAGQCSGMIKDIKPVKEIIEDIIGEVEEILSNLQNLKD